MNDTFTQEKKNDEQARLWAEWNKLNSERTRIQERGEKVKYRRRGE